MTAKRITWLDGIEVRQDGVEVGIAQAIDVLTPLTVADEGDGVLSITGPGGGAPDVDAVVAGPGITSQPSATGTKSLVGGHGALDHAKPNAVVLGTAAECAGNNGTCIGDGTFVGGNNGTACGFDASAQGVDSVAIGSGALAVSTSCTAIGPNTVAGKTTSSVQATAIGYCAFAPMNGMVSCAGALGIDGGNVPVQFNFATMQGKIVGNASVELVGPTGGGFQYLDLHNLVFNEGHAVLRVEASAYNKTDDVQQTFVWTVAVSRKSGATRISAQGTQEQIGDAGGALWTLIADVASSPERIRLTFTGTGSGATYIHAHVRAITQQSVA